jgi:undecaprenyl pyrophosphate phosphatase UppP
MNSTVKTVLIVGGVAVGVVLLFKVLSPSPAAGAKPPAGTKSTDIVSWNGIFSLGAAALSALGGGSSSSGSTAGGSSATTVIDGMDATDFASGHFGVDYDADPSDFASGHFGVDYAD